MIPSHRALAGLAAVAFFVLCPPALLRAEEVRWRHDYNVARHEARERGLPLVIDFGTTACYWCKRLDVTTFRDAQIVAAMNRGFIALKVDGERDAQLAQALQVTSYPTLVFAAANGKILLKHEGYMDPAKFAEALQRVVANIANGEWMTHDFDAAAKAVSTGDQARAVALLQGIVEDGKDRPVQTKARQMLKEIGNTSGGTAAGGEQRRRQAAELLARARDDYRGQQYLCCLDRCELLAVSYRDLPEAAEALQMAVAIKNNTEWMTKACDDLGDRLGTLYLSLAESWVAKGQPQQAVVYLERVLRAFPGTRHAEAAQLRMTQIRAGGINAN